MSHLEQNIIQYMRNKARPRDQDKDRTAAAARDPPPASRPPRDRPPRERDHDRDHNRDADRDHPSCPDCHAEAPRDLDGFRAHVLADAPGHARLKDDAAIVDAFRKVSLRRQLSGTQHLRSGGKRPLPGAADARDDTSDSGRPDPSPDSTDDSRHESKKRFSPPASLTPLRGSSPPTPRDRSRARITSPSERPRPGRKHASGRGLWEPGDQGPKTSSTRAAQLQEKLGLPGLPSSKDSRSMPSHHSEPRKHAVLPYPESNDPNKMMKEPETRPISQEQLVHEVKGIYAGLVMVESKCIEVNNTQAKNSDNKQPLSQEQWQALITLHRTLLQEHHDFFLASQHPSANDALKRLASKYFMPARMWRHGIHSFLELLRHRLPESRDYMLTFIYLAYSIMALLYETVPTFEDTWVECLGDLGRYRMAIEEDDIRDRETWTGVSRHWYSKASEKAPTTGRLYHHLAILARPNALQQLFCYSKSLCVVIPFLSARDSIITLFDPLLTNDNPRVMPVDANFVRVQGVLFSGKANSKLCGWRDEFIRDLDAHIGRTARRWLESGYFIGISLSCSLLGFGDQSNVLMRAISRHRDDVDVPMEGSAAEAGPGENFETALSFAVETWSIVIKRWGDLNTLPCHHTMMVFLLHMSRFPAAMAYIQDKLPWKLTSVMLNYLKKTTTYRPKLSEDDDEDDAESFAAPMLEQHRPLPDDYALRGLVYAEDYLPRENFPDDIDEDEKYFELSSMAEERVKRILWLGCKIAKSKKWLTWNAESDEFGFAIDYDVAIEEGPAASTTPERSSPVPAVMAGEG